MREFPKKISVNNKEHFNEYHFERCLCYLRRDIIEFLYKRGDDVKNENDYFQLDKFNEEYVGNKEVMAKLVDIVIEELEADGMNWNCKTCFHNTGLFIYSTEEPPPSCWGGDEEFS